MFERLRNYVAGVAHARTETKRVVRRLAVLLVATVGVTVVCAVVMYASDGGAPNSDITSFGLALFWSASQLLSVGSSLSDPVTTAGRILSLGMDVYSVVVIGTISGTLGAFFMHRIGKRMRLVEEDGADGARAEVDPAGGDGQRDGS